METRSPVSKFVAGHHDGRRVNSAVGGTGTALVRPRRGFGDYLETALPKIVLGPTLLCALIFVYGFILWTA